MQLVVTSSAVEIIQLALAPIFLIVGIGTLVNVATGRVSRIIDRARWLENLGIKEPERINRNVRSEIRSLNRRMRLANWSISFLIAAAVTTCINVMLLLFNGLIQFSLDVTILIVFMVCMTLLTGGLIAFFLEVSLATATLKVKAVDLKRL